MSGGSSPRAQDLQAAPIRDGLVSHVTVTDQHHALCGQLLPLVSLHSARGPAYVVVALPDGRLLLWPCRMGDAARCAVRRPIWPGRRKPHWTTAGRLPGARCFPGLGILSPAAPFP